MIYFHTWLYGCYMHYYPVNITKVLNNQTIIIKNKNKKNNTKKNEIAKALLCGFFFVTYKWEIWWAPILLRTFLRGHSSQQWEVYLIILALGAPRWRQQVHIFLDMINYMKEGNCIVIVTMCINCIPVYISGLHRPTYTLIIT